MPSEFFFCQACLEDNPPNEASPDERYCQDCYEFLLEEAKLLSAGQFPKWRPQHNKQKIEGEKTIPVSPDEYPIMSNMESKNFVLDKIQPSVATKVISNRGRKRRALPLELITQLADEGLGSWAIASRLKDEQSLDISYKTIQRILSGERK